MPVLSAVPSSFSVIAEEALSRAEALVPRWLPAGKREGSEWVAANPTRTDRTPGSFKISLTTGQWADFATGDKGGDLISLHAYLNNLKQGEAAAKLSAELGLQPSPGARRNPHISLANLARDKGLPESFLRDLGLADRPGGGVTIPYRNADGSVFRTRLRTALKAKEGSSWLNDGKGQIPYGLNRLEHAREAGRLVLVEGESDCWTLWFHSYPALGIPGANAVKVLQAEHLAGINTVYAVQETDPAGATFIQGLSKRLTAIGYRGTFHVLRLPTKDPNELHKSDPEGFRAAFDAALKGAVKPDVETAQEARSGPGPSDTITPETPRRASQATRLVNLGHEAELWHDPEGISYATIQIDGHYEHWAIDSRGYRDWLRRRFYTAEHRAPSGQAMTDATGVLSGIARYDGPEYMAYLRLASHAGAIYIDLADRAWRAIEVTAAGWRIVDAPPVRYMRRRGMLALPEPKRGGLLSDLWPHLHIREEDRPLAAGWVIAAMRDRGPYPVLCLQGEADSAKTTTARVLRSLIDPSVAMVRTTPREERDLIVAARNGWVIGLDNLSGLPPWLSDALCRLATGGGYSARELYTDADEVLIDVQRPVILTGIDEIASRQDLISRSIILTLDAIHDEARRPEAEYWTAIERIRPSVLGALLDAVAHALRELPSVHLDRLPRMADAALWVTAAEPMTGWPRGAFLRQYDHARRDAVHSALEGSPVARVLLAMLEERDTWTGTATELLTALGSRASEAERALESWPKSGRGLSGQLRRLATGLRAIGISVEWPPRSGQHGRGIKIRKVAKQPSQPSPSSPAYSGNGAGSDGRVTVGDDSADQPSPWDTHSRNEDDGSDGSDGRNHIFRIMDDDQGDEPEEVFG